jgi:imidazole glycerol phosphate synthase subunit HisF
MCAGEIVINSIDNEDNEGIDLYLACKIRDKINIPLTILEEPEVWMIGDN